MSTPIPQIRRAHRAEAETRLVELTRELLADGTTYVFRPEATDGELADYWFPRPGKTYLAEVDEVAAACYLLRPNHPGRGDHIANASYFVGRRFRGSGLGRALAEHSLHRARDAGFRAMQFNLVVSTNHGAIALWTSLGFEVLGVVPEGFDHAHLGLTDVLIMHRRL